MLKRVITTSARLAALKNDTHRLIYTWMIPFLDVEGRMEADPRIIKGHIAPLLDHITTRIIELALKDMSINTLIILYESKDNKYLQLLRFDKHQNLRKDREKESEIPPPPPEDAGITPGGLPEDAGITPKQVKLSLNLSKDKDIVKPSDVGLTLASLLFEKIKSRNHAHKPPDLKVWAKDIDLMISRDARDPTEIEEVICWCQNNDFWKNNILSPGKLRKQYDQLVLKMTDPSECDLKPRKENLREWAAESEQSET